MSPTNFLPPQAIFSSGQITGTGWTDEANIFLVDGDFAVSQGTSDFIISNFNFNIPVGSVVNGIEIEIIGKIGGVTIPATSLTVSAYDNVNGTDTYYPYTAPVTSLTTSVTTVTIGGPTYLFSTTWTVDQINNFKLALEANNNISLDSVLVKVYFTPPATESLNYNTLVGTFTVGETVTDTITGATGKIVTDNGANLMTITNVTGYFQPGDSILGGTSGATALLDTTTAGVCVDCSSPVQVQAMYLELPFLAGQTKFYLKKGSFSYPNGIPVQPGDIGSCGGTLPFVFDESKSKQAGGNWEENALLDTTIGGTWTVLTSGVIEVDLVSVTQRGLDYHTPAVHVAANMSDHDANSKVIISNNEPYNLQLLRTCQKDIVFSAPIKVDDEGITLTTAVHEIDFVGAGVTSTLVSPNKVRVNIPGGGGGGITLQTDGVSNGDQTLLNLIAGSNITLTDDGVGGVTIDSTGGSGGGDVVNTYTATGTTLALTTLAGDVVTVWAKGTYAGSATASTILLKYNSVTKDTVNVDLVDSDPTHESNCFALEYTETPGAATHNITVTSAGYTLSDVVIIAQVVTPGGGTGITFETDGVANGDQTLLNLAAGTGITLTDNGTGTVTIDSTSSSAADVQTFTSSGTWTKASWNS